MGEWETKLDGYCRFCGTRIVWSPDRYGQGLGYWADADGLALCRSEEHGLKHHKPPLDAVQYPQAPEARTSAADLLDYVRTMARASGQYGMSLGPEQTRTVLGYVDELLEQIEKLKAESARLTETIVFNREQYAKEREGTVERMRRLAAREEVEPF